MPVFIVLGCFAAFIALGTVAILSGLQDKRTKTARALMREAEETVVFLFEDTTLVDATPAAHAMLKTRTTESSDWDRFLGLFGPQFPHLRGKLATLAQNGAKTITSRDNPDVRLEAELWDGYARLSVVDDSSAKRSFDQAAIQSLEDELDTFRLMAEGTPQIIWKEDSGGTITWANSAYMDHAGRYDGYDPSEIPAWPPARLFNHPNGAAFPLRDCVQLPGDPEPRWFEISRCQVANHHVFFGTEISAVIKAEETQRSHVQTLANTFAQLSTGLAIFDKDRKLVIFNPALTDLLGLPIDFLSAKPAIHTFLNRLRETGMAPDVPDFAEWKTSIVTLETQTRQGRYCEKWDLPNGQVFRVTGRPHPNGASALLFEDISAEITINRRFLAQLETNQYVIDTASEAIAAFSETGALLMTNKAYDDLWTDKTDSPVAGSGLTEETRKWQSVALPSTSWKSFTDRLSQPDQATEWSDIVRLPTGQSFTCVARRMGNGGIVVRFAASAPETGSREVVSRLWAAHG